MLCLALILWPRWATSGSAVFSIGDAEALGEARASPTSPRAHTGKQHAGFRCELYRWRDSRYIDPCWIEARRGEMDRGDGLQKGREFTAEVILWAVRRSLMSPISYRDLEPMLLDRGVEVDDTTVFRLDPGLCRGT